MAKLVYAPIPTDDKEAALAALIEYKKQNPKKFEAKKEALLKKYGLSLDTQVEVPQDQTDIELEALKSKVKKAK